MNENIVLKKPIGTLSKNAIFKEQVLIASVYNSSFGEAFVNSSFVINYDDEEMIVPLKDLLSPEVSFEVALKKFLDTHAKKNLRRRLAVKIFNKLEEFGFVIHYVSKRIHHVDIARLSAALRLTEL